MSSSSSSTKIIDSYFLPNDVCVVSGASSGIGKKIALELSKFRTKTKSLLEQVSQECISLGASSTLVIPCDVSNEEQCKNAIQSIHSKYNGRLDKLFLCAGISGSIPFEHIQDMSIFEQMFKTNVMGYIYLTKFSLPLLKQSKSNPHICVMSSMSGVIPIPMRTAYCMSKFAVEGFFRTLRTELKHTKDAKHICITLICPGWVDTDIRKHHVTEHQTNYDNGSKMMSVEECVKKTLKAVREKKGTQRFKTLYHWSPIIYELYPKFIEDLTVKKTGFSQLMYRVEHNSQAEQSTTSRPSKL
nr:unnamed protein product [Naegleria fowleri]